MTTLYKSTDYKYKNKETRSTRYINMTKAEIYDYTIGLNYRFNDTLYCYIERVAIISCDTNKLIGYELMLEEI